MTLQIGTKVWYHTFSDERLAAVITGHGRKDGQPVYDVEVEGWRTTDKLGRYLWGYEDQIEPRS